MTDDKKEEAIVFVDALTDSLGRSEGQSIEEVKKELQEEGIDVDATMKRLMDMVSETSKAARRKQLDLAREKRQEMESRKDKLLIKYAKWTKEKVISKINELLSLPEPDVSVAYRDLDLKTTEDLRSLLVNLEMAKQRNEYEKGSNEE